MHAGSLDRAAELLRTGRAAEAEAVLRRVVQGQAREGRGHLMLAEALVRQGKTEQAINYARMASELLPGAQVTVNLGFLLLNAGRAAEALEAFLEGRRRQPGHAGCLSAAGVALAKLGRLADAEVAMREAVALEPRSASATNNLAKHQADQGRADFAVATLCDGLARGCDRAVLVRSLALYCNYVMENPAETAAVYSEAGAMVMRALPRMPARAAEGKERRLKVAFLGGELHRHSVTYYLRGVFDHLDSAQFELGAYSTGRAEDDVSRALAERCSFWRRLPGAGGSAIADKIRADGVDVLIDLGGWLLETGHIDVLARQPAPLQLTYCGFPNTTGLATVYGRIVDSTTDPDGSEAFSSERLLRLDPCFLCYRGPTEAPEVRAREPGPIRFGSFNAVWKITPRTAAAWGGAMRAAPGSTLTIKVSTGATAKLAEWLPGALGVEPARVTILPHEAKPEDHYARYHAIDVALDTFPYGGTATTCEALWMGVPVVTMRGRTHASRVGASLLSAVGLTELVADDAAAFAHVAGSLAGDGARLADLRAGLRAKMRQSVLMDERGHATKFGALVREAWRAVAV